MGRKDTPILPKAGDYAIGVEATPYLNYLGNIFNNTENNSLELGSQTLHGRYFLDDNTALRLSLTIQADSYTDRYYVRDDAAFYQDNLSNDKTVDAQKTIQNEVGLGIGLQKFRGYGRLGGTYGAIAYFSYEKDKYEYTYGNPITSTNQTPTSYWGNQSERELEYNYGASKTIGVAALAGVEYYFAHKILQRPKIPPKSLPETNFPYICTTNFGFSVATSGLKGNPVLPQRKNPELSPQL